MAKKPWKDPATWDDGMPRRPLSFEAEVWGRHEVSRSCRLLRPHVKITKRSAFLFMAENGVSRHLATLSVSQEFHPSVPRAVRCFSNVRKTTSKVYIWRPFGRTNKKVWCMRSIAKIMCVLLGTLMRFFMIKMLKFQLNLKDPRWPNWPGQLADRHETSAWLARNLSRIWAQGAPSLDSLQWSVRAVRALQSVFGSSKVVTILTNLSQNNSARNPRFQPRWMNPIAKSLPFHPRRCSASFASFWRKIQIQLLSGKVDQPESLECRGSAELHGIVCFHTGSPDSKWCHLRFTWRDIELLCYYFGWNCWPFSKKGLENEVTRWIWRWNLRNPRASYTEGNNLHADHTLWKRKTRKIAAFPKRSKCSNRCLWRTNGRSNHAVSSSFISKNSGKLKAFCVQRILRAPPFFGGRKSIHPLPQFSWWRSREIAHFPPFTRLSAFRPTPVLPDTTSRFFELCKKKTTVAALSRNLVTRDVSLNPTSPCENLWVNKLLDDSPKALNDGSLFTRETLIFVWMFMVCSWFTCCVS